MFGPRITTVFRSRWNAVLWSVGILLTAYCSVPSPEEADSAQQQAAEAAVRKLLGQKPAAHDAGARANPWAMDTGKPDGD